MKENSRDRLTLDDITEYPRPYDLYQELMRSRGWDYKDNMERFLMRDRALVALLYLGDFRISEVLPLKKEQFTIYEDHVHVKGVLVGKRKPNKVQYREAKLPLHGERAVFTRLIIDYLEYLQPQDRLFPFSLTKRKYLIKKRPYKLKDGTVKDRFSFQMVGTKRAYQIVKALLPNYTQHWLRAFGYSFDYDHMEHDLLAVSDKTKADPSSLQLYLRRRYEKYPVR
jgi:hypothetical protein